jgi:hypothetical protein
MKNGKKHPGIRYSVAAAAVTASLLGGFALAQSLSEERGVPPALYYTGELTDEHGYVSGSVSVTVGIYENDGSDGDPLCSVTETVEVANGQFSVSVANCASHIIEAQKQAGRTLYSGVTVERNGDSVTFPRRPIGAVPFAVSAAYAAKSKTFEAEKVFLPAQSGSVMHLDPSQGTALQVGTSSVSKDAVVHGKVTSNALQTKDVLVANSSGGGKLTVTQSNGANALKVDGNGETVLQVGNPGSDSKHVRVSGTVFADWLRAKLPVYLKHCNHSYDCSCNSEEHTLFETYPDYFLAVSYASSGHKWSAACVDGVGGRQVAKTISVICAYW